MNRILGHDPQAAMFPQQFGERSLIGYTPLDLPATQVRTTPLNFCKVCFLFKLVHLEFTVGVGGVCSQLNDAFVASLGYQPPLLLVFLRVNSLSPLSSITCAVVTTSGGPLGPPFSGQWNKLNIWQRRVSPSTYQVCQKGWLSTKNGPNLRS